MQIANSLPRKLNAVADMIPYDNTDSNLKSTNIQDAIDELDNENDVLHDCSTARNTIAKVVAYDGFVLKKGAKVYVRFTDTGTENPTSGNLTLNVNNTGAKNIVDGKSNKTVLTYSSCIWFYNNMVHEFIYDGTYWVWMTRDNNTTYTGATLKTGAAKTGSGTTVTDTIAKSTTIDNAIGTLLNNDCALNSSLTEAKTDIDTLNSNLANFTDNKNYDGHVNNIIENSIKYSIGAQGLPANVNTYGLIVTLVSGKTGTTVQNAKQLYFPYSDITGYYIRSCVDGNWYPWYRINGVAI